MRKFLCAEPIEAVLDILSEALDLVDIGILLLNRDMRVIFINRYQADLFGLPPELLASGPTFRALLDHAAANTWYSVHPGRLAQYIDERDAAVRAGSIPATELNLADGRRIRFTCIACPDGGRILTYADISAELRQEASDATEQIGAEMRFNSELLADQGAYLAELAEAADKNARQVEAARVQLEHEITERNHLEAELRRLAATDGLTGVLNRVGFLAAAKQAVEDAIRRNEDLAMLMIDVDHFKSINDRYGHAGGDLALQVLASALRVEIRQADILGRMGGEEFAILLSATAREVADRVAERLRSRVASTATTFGDRTISMTISIGLTLRKESDDAIEPLLARADAALYRAKSSGRNRVVRDDQIADAALTNC